MAQSLPDLQFKIAGETILDVDKNTVNAIKNLKALSNVEFIGLLARNKISEFLSKAYFLLNTSHYEGFSNTYLEAFRVGTPVITRNETDPDDIISNNELGICVKLYTDLVDIIPSFINDYDHTIHQRTKEYIRRYHNPKELAKKIIDYL